MVSVIMMGQVFAVNVHFSMMEPIVINVRMIERIRSVEAEK